MVEQHQKNVIGEGRFLRLVSDQGWEYVERRRCRAVVGVVAVTVEKKILLVEQFRPALGQATIELPAGLVGDGGDEKENILDAARRELLEETGYAARDLAILTEGPSSSGLTSEVVTIVLARGLKKENAGGGVGGERITVHEVPLSEVDPWLEDRRKSGRAIDPRIYVGLYGLLRASRPDCGS